MSSNWKYYAATRPRTLFHHSPQRFNSRFSIARIGLGSSLAIVVLVLGALPSHPQGIPNQPSISVPPPPPIPDSQPPLAPTPFQREAIFQAPAGTQGMNAARYVVYVNGDSPYLLQQVQTVEPRAFVEQYQGRPVIQVGTYSDEAIARQQVETLRMQGITAEMGYNSMAYPPASSSSQSSPYVVIVPGRQENLENLAQQAMRLGIRRESVQIKDAPLGWHLEIGPFRDYREAKEVDQYLRRGGMDSRVYYSR
ncbi:hypothetical protein [Leptothermofonsia sp. ETS-13]|uniref:hypothetical protein n=1 Tax=Leptothermofonsia sp. ETS-13 TaxID=3035696 RepID=UPI003B9E23EF